MSMRGGATARRWTGRLAWMRCSGVTAKARILSQIGRINFGHIRPVRLFANVMRPIAPMLGSSTCYQAASCGIVRSSARISAATNVCIPRLFPAAIRHIADKSVAPDPLDRRPRKKLARNAASSNAKRSARRGATSSARGRNALLAAALVGKFVPRANRKAIVAAIDMIADQRRAARAQSVPYARWSDRKCTAAHRPDMARERHRSGRYPDRRGTIRNCRRRAASGSSSAVV